MKRFFKFLLLSSLSFLLSCAEYIRTNQAINIDLDYEESTKTPQYYFTELAIKLPPGKKTVVDGVIIQNRPAPEIADPLVTNLPLSNQNKIKLKPIVGKGPDFDIKRLNQCIELAKAKAAYQGRYLSADKKTKLIELSESHVRAVAELDNKYSRASTYDTLLKQKSILITRYLVDKRKLFEGNVKAQVAAYDRKLTKPTSSLDIKRIEKNMYRFISGQYMMDSRKRTAATAGSRTTRLPPDTSSGTDTSGRNLQCKAPITGETRRTSKDTELETYFGVNIWIADFNILATDDIPIIGDFFEENKAVHTSLVTEITRIKKYRREVVIYNDNTVIGNKYWYVYKKDRLEWGPANGCAYKYNADDRVSLVSASTFSSLDQAKKYAYQYTPPFKIRTSAYSAGCYGSDWICHTSCNAFSYRRWGLISFDTFDVFGNFGKRGISPDVDSCGIQHAGCVPGKACYYHTQHAHNTCPPGCGVGPIAGMKGDGYKLSVVWNTVSQSWEASGVRYKSVKVPENLIQSHFEIEYCPTTDEPQTCRQDTQCPAGSSCIKTPVNGVEACPTADATAICWCITNQTSPGNGGTPPPDDYWDDLGKSCQSPSDCGGNTWCLTTGFCGNFPESCFKSAQCPMNYECGSFETVGSNLVFKSCTFADLQQGKCKCEATEGGPH